jgi:Flp pilus assembly protein TadG
MRKALTKVAGSFAARLDGLRTKTSGSVSVVVAVSIVPLLVSMGIAIDMSHGVATRAALQTLADAASLAGANAYTDPTQGTTAQNVAQAYINSYAARSGMKITGSSVVVSPTSWAGYDSVSVSISATVPTLLLSVVNSSAVNITTKSVAGISPTLLPLTVCGASIGCPSQLTGSAVKSTAADFNAMFLYGVPKDSSGNYAFNLLPPNISGYWELGGNCSGLVDSSWTNQSRCNSAFGATVPSNQAKVLLLPPDQPIAMVFLNQNNGMAAPGSSGYGSNQYGADPGNFNLMFTALLSLSTPASPSSAADGSVSLMKSMFGQTISKQSTNYSTTYTARKTATLSNCSVQIVLVLDPTNPPTSPPYPGQCLAPSDSRSGFQYANLSCNQIAGRTFMYWWNDMGAPTDDLDYKNLSYMLTCQPGVSSTDGGTIAAANPVVHKVAGLLK